MRSGRAAEYVGNPSPLLVAGLGVAGSDLVTLFTQGPVTMVGQRIPFFTVPPNPLLSKEDKQAYRRALRKGDKAVLEFLGLEKKKRKRYAEGGPVELEDTRFEVVPERDYMEDMSTWGPVRRGLGISDEDIDWASNDVGTDFPDEFDGKADAARHLALGWLAKQSGYPSISKALIDLRELGDSGGKMDKRNNQLGFDIEAATKEEAREEIHRLINEGEAEYMTQKESKEMRGY